MSPYHSWEAIDVHYAETPLQAFIGDDRNAVSDMCGVWKSADFLRTYQIPGKLCEHGRINKPPFCAAQHRILPHTIRGMGGLGIFLRSRITKAFVMVAFDLAVPINVLSSLDHLQPLFTTQTSHETKLLSLEKRVSRLTRLYEIGQPLSHLN